MYFRELLSAYFKKKLPVASQFALHKHNNVILRLTTLCWLRCRGEIPKSADLLLNEDIVKLKRCIFASQVRCSFLV